MHVMSYVALTVYGVLAAPGPNVQGDADTMISEDTSDGAAFLPDVFSFREPCRPQIDLTGTWEFRRDPDGTGKAEGWHRGDGDFPDSVQAPGAPQAQGFGEPHQYQKTAFREPFWMRRTFRVPELDSNQRVWLRIGGILPAAEIYVNGTYVGYTKSSRTQQRVDVTQWSKADASNLIAIKVCDFPEVRLDGLLEWNEGTQIWTGAYRPIACEIADRVSVIDLYVQPDLSSGSVVVDLELSETSPGLLRATLSVSDDGHTLGESEVMIPAGERRVRAEVKLADFTAWSPEHPILYALNVSLVRDGVDHAIDKTRIRFGMREISVEGTKFYLNGKPIFLRVYGEDHYYPDTLCPPSDIEWYRPRLERARAYGMNATKGCVETIPQDYVEAADEAGILIIQEMPFGLSTLRANRYTIDERFREYYRQELDGLVRVSRNHASVVAYSMSSELEFHNQTQESFDFFSRDLVQHTRRLAPHALVIDCTGYVNTEETDKGKRDTSFYASIHPKWMKEALDETDMKTDGLHPTILHEYNWWSCYPDPADKDKYAEAQLKPFWFDTLLTTARENGQEELLRVYRKNSLWLQALCRKDGIEYARRSPGVEGYILWLLIDFGHWSEGLLDDFWNPKNVSPEELLKSNGDTVILLAEEGERCFEMGTTAQIPLAVSHYGENDYSGSELHWRALRGDELQNGTLAIDRLDHGTFTRAGFAEIDLPVTERAYKFELHTALHHDDDVINTNEWSFWAFPETRDWFVQVAEATPSETLTELGFFVQRDEAQVAAIPDDASLVLAESVNEALAEFIEAGGRCLLFSRGSVSENAMSHNGIFRTIPWNAGNSGNSGTVILDHAAMAEFPHEGMCDLPFVRMIVGFFPMEFSPLREYGVTPIIRGIDHYVANRNNAYMLEFGVGRGKVLVTSLGIMQNAPEHIEARYLLKSLADYAASARFQPSANLPKAKFLELFRAGGGT